MQANDRCAECKEPLPRSPRDELIAGFLGGCNCKLHYKCLGGFQHSVPPTTGEFVIPKPCPFCQGGHPQECDPCRDVHDYKGLESNPKECKDPRCDRCLLMFCRKRLAVLFKKKGTLLLQRYSAVPKQYPEETKAELEDIHRTLENKWPEITCFAQYCESLVHLGELFHYYDDSLDSLRKFLGLRAFSGLMLMMPEAVRRDCVNVPVPQVVEIVRGLIRDCVGGLIPAAAGANAALKHVLFRVHREALQGRPRCADLAYAYPPATGYSETDFKVGMCISTVLQEDSKRVTMETLQGACRHCRPLAMFLGSRHCSLRPYKAWATIRADGRGRVPFCIQGRQVARLPPQDNVPQGALLVPSGRHDGFWAVCPFILATWQHGLVQVVNTSLEGCEDADRTELRRIEVEQQCRLVMVEVCMPNEIARRRALRRLVCVFLVFLGITAVLVWRAFDGRVDCSNAPDCASLRRKECIATGSWSSRKTRRNMCGGCLSGYVPMEKPGPGLSPCLAPGGASQVMTWKYGSFQLQQMAHDTSPDAKVDVTTFVGSVTLNEQFPAGGTLYYAVNRLIPCKEVEKLKAEGDSHVNTLTIKPGKTARLYAVVCAGNPLLQDNRCLAQGADDCRLSLLVCYRPSEAHAGSNGTFVFAVYRGVGCLPPLSAEEQPRKICGIIPVTEPLEYRLVTIRNASISPRVGFADETLCVAMCPVGGCSHPYEALMAFSQNRPSLHMYRDAHDFVNVELNSPNIRPVPYAVGFRGGDHCTPIGTGTCENVRYSSTWSMTVCSWLAPSPEEPRWICRGEHLERTPWLEFTLFNRQLPKGVAEALCRAQGQLTGCPWGFFENEHVCVRERIEVGMPHGAPLSLDALWL